MTEIAVDISEVGSSRMCGVSFRLNECVLERSMLNRLIYLKRIVARLIIRICSVLLSILFLKNFLQEDSPVME